MCWLDLFQGSQPVWILESILPAVEKSPQNAGFFNVEKSLGCPFSNFRGENSQKSLGIYWKIPVFQTLAPETRE
ncbi:hypothetical protein HMPREF9696_04010 [Afipia clevelandensis ATCC 49720]|uniref:Uncharacterized protein n=1 Tax=Afipia clevelandensis ATCC 49720 TaxID=883079 RepID=K8NTK1_9BRAD|nr:hypothetical protein HMPREF9696_04010 [Afipia clevelandensis ATCC 49720]